MVWKEIRFPTEFRYSVEHTEALPACSADGVYAGVAVLDGQEYRAGL